ncbi:MAG: Rad52/Rad22 family DNA repair protein [Longimicrobiales bacterium]
MESVKGGLSAATKRAAVEWGIGRYLYGIEEGWANVPTAAGSAGR